jgi:hypothetical protein
LLDTVGLDLGAWGLVVKFGAWIAMLLQHSYPFALCYTHECCHF